MKKTATTPILFIIFNRPETTSAVFNKIKELKPKDLFIAADGPRKDKIGEFELCEATRKITESIDWKCNVRRLYRKNNLGCGKAVSGAINWFFKNVDCGIILEDDCLPNDSFYSFASNLLDKYKDDVEIMHISGNNFLNNQMHLDNVYYVSSYPHVWGWATWKRAWDRYDYEIRDWKNKSLCYKIKSVKGDIWNKLFWVSKFDSVNYKVTDTWDYQWVFCVMKYNGLSLFSGTNLVSNIGFGVKSTHTSGNNNRYSNLKTSSLLNKISLSSKRKGQIDLIEEREVFRTKSLTTLIHFAYFSIFCMLYNKLYKKI
jgi:hypothetical protein